MNRKQWYFLAAVCFLFAMFSIRLDLGNGFLFASSQVGDSGNPCLDVDASSLMIKYNLLEKVKSEEITFEEYLEIEGGIKTLDKHDVICLLGAEMYEPFVYLFNLLWPVLLICAWLEPRQKGSGRIRIRG